jgi:hypothetical protein
LIHALAKGAGVEARLGLLFVLVGFALKASVYFAIGGPSARAFVVEPY